MYRQQVQTVAINSQNYLFELGNIEEKTTGWLAVGVSPSHHSQSVGLSYNGSRGVHKNNKRGFKNVYDCQNLNYFNNSTTPIINKCWNISNISIFWDYHS